MLLRHALPSSLLLINNTIHNFQTGAYCQLVIWFLLMLAVAAWFSSKEEKLGLAGPKGPIDQTMTVP